MTDTSSALRNALVDQIQAQRTLPPLVEIALRTVRRELHLPNVDLADAYSNKAITIKDNPAGPLALSCASVPSVVAMMLTQLEVLPGDRILEIGAGTGYNAALLAELTGKKGEVTTLDIDEDVTLHARNALNHTGYEDVRVIQRDGLEGAPEHAPYDRIIATVGIWDIPTTLRDQLAEGGRFVVPLRWRGQTRSVALTRTGDSLHSHDMPLCGFVPIVGQDGERTTEIAGGSIRIHHDHDQPIDPGQLSSTLRGGPATEHWSDVHVGNREPFDGIWLRATVVTDTVCRLEATETALANGLRRPVIPIRTPALVTGDSLAYLITRREPDNTAPSSRLGAAAYGPHGHALASELIEIITAWGANRTAIPQLSIHPGDTPQTDLPGHTIAKSDSLLVLSYT